MRIPTVPVPTVPVPTMPVPVVESNRSERDATIAGVFLTLDVFPGDAAVAG